MGKYQHVKVTFRTGEFLLSLLLLIVIGVFASLMLFLSIAKNDFIWLLTKIIPKCMITTATASERLFECWLFANHNSAIYYIMMMMICILNHNIPFPNLIKYIVHCYEQLWLCYLCLSKYCPYAEKTQTLGSFPAQKYMVQFSFKINSISIQRQSFCLHRLFRSKFSDDGMSRILQAFCNNKTLTHFW